MLNLTGNFYDITTVLIVAFIPTLLFTPFIRTIMRRADITDKPIVSEHSHKKGTPIMGGLAILLAAGLVLSIYYKNLFLGITIVMMMVSGIIGLLDDLLGLKIKEWQDVVVNMSENPIVLGRLTLKPGDEARVTTPKAKKEVTGLLKKGVLKKIREVPIKSEVREREKIIAQIIVSIFLIVSGVVGSTLWGLNLGILIIPIIIIGVVGSINAINLIDGMDGMAAGILTISTFSCALFCFLNGKIEISMTFMALSGLCLGFLFYNRYPASIFMGDTGSFALGAGYATAALVGDVVNFAVVALTVPIVSVIVSLLHRSQVIKLPVEPLHHSLHYWGLSEVKIVSLYWLITIIICLVALYFHPLF